MNSFEIDDSNEWFDLGLSASSGQTFRWQKLPDGRWLGVDGPHWYLVDGAQVQSNATAEDFGRLFRLDWDAAAIERQVAEADPALGQYVSALRGLRVMRQTDAEETFFTFLCTPNNNVPRITGMVRALADYGPVMAVVEGVELRRFPDAATIAAIPEQELRDKRFGYRAATITSAAHQVLDRGPGWLNSLRDKPYRQAHEELIGIKGIGRKLADCIALFGLHHGEAVPVDTHVWQQVIRLYRPEWAEKSLTDARYLEAGQIFRDKFGDLSGWAHQFLFYENLLNWRTR